MSQTRALSFEPKRMYAIEFLRENGIFFKSNGGERMKYMDKM